MPTVYCAPDELKKFAGDQEESTEVFQAPDEAEHMEFIRAPVQPKAVVRPPDDPTEFACGPTIASAQDELI